jgi:hypothetical protein
MEEQFFDDLAKGLDDGTISRRRALKLAGGALLAAVVPTFFPREAEAINRAKRRCRRKGGVYRAGGNCHCTRHCSSDIEKNFTCQNNASCLCLETVEGRGFCADATAATNPGCTSSAQCSQQGHMCVIQRGCPDGGGSCTSNTQCQSISPAFACINGTCQHTSCFPPCT